MKLYGDGYSTTIFYLCCVLEKITESFYKSFILPPILYLSLKTELANVGLSGITILSPILN
jgi:hypothetical protein